MTPADTSCGPPKNAPGEGRQGPLRVKILRDRYQSQFMSPRASRHDIVRTRFVPFNKLNRRWDGFTFLPPLPRAGLIHAHNRIPLAGERMICSFESSLPRRYGMADNDPILRRMLDKVAAPRCRRIIGMSHHARRNFLHQHRDDPRLEDMRRKLFVRHPNVTLGPEEDRMPAPDSRRLVVTFVGGPFGRKGGAACVRAAEICLERGVPVEMNIVSRLTCGAGVWTDPSADGFLTRI